MDNEKKMTSGIDTETSGSVAQETEQVSTSGETSSKSAYEKLLKEKKNASMALHETKNKLAELESWKSKIEEDDLLRKQQYETVIDNYKTKLAEKESELNKERETIKKSKMNGAVMLELKNLGFVDSGQNRQAALKLINTQKMALDPETNVVIGADEAAKEFYSSFNGLGFFAKNPAQVNQSAHKINLNMGGGQVSSLSKQELIDKLRTLSKKD